MKSRAIERVDELVAFTATAQAGSLSAAARTLRVPVNQVSRRLARLEERLGVVLIARTTRSLRLTAEGERFLLRARRVLDELEAAELELLDGAGPSGTMRLALPTIFTGSPVLAELLVALRSHPALSLELLVRDAPLDPIADGCDAVVVVGRPEASSCRLIPLGDVAPVLAATPGYLAHAGVPTRPEDLVRHECLRFVDGSLQTHWPLTGPQGVRRDVPISGRFASDNSRVLRDALRAGVGIGLLPERILRTVETTLVRVLAGYAFGPFELYALCPPGSRGSSRHELALTLLRRAVDLMT